MPKYLKILLLSLGIIFGCLILVAATIFFTFIYKPYADRKLVESTAIGKAFVGLYPGAISYELNTSETVFLDTIWGSTALQVTVPKNGKAAEYTLRCYQGTTNTTYFTLQGLSQEMIDYVTSEKCFTHEPDYEQLKRYRVPKSF